MPGGGTWETQNKRRPGAYINVVSEPRAIGTLGTRGVMTAALPMTWGPQNALIELYATDLYNGRSEAKIGVNGFDTEASLPYRLCTTGAYKALLYRLDTGGTIATGTIEGTPTSNTITMSANYAGTTGNDLSISIEQDIAVTTNYFVNIFFRNRLVERFTILAVTDLEDIESQWVTFTVVGTFDTVPVTAGVTLQGGTNGTVESTQLDTYFGLIDTEQWQTMTVASTDATLGQAITTKISQLRDQRGKKVQGVVYNYTAADTPGIISVNQGFQTPTDVVSTNLFPLWVASITAGANVNESNTARVVEAATTILNPVPEEEIADALDAGRFILSYRQDGAVVVEQDINTFISFTADRNSEFSKNRVIRTLDEICNTAALIFNRNYLGRVNNDDLGRNTYKLELITMMDNLQDIGAVQNFAGATDIQVYPGQDIDSVVVDLYVQPVDSMEKLYMTVHVNIIVNAA